MNSLYNISKSNNLTLFMFKIFFVFMWISVNMNEKNAYKMFLNWQIGDYTFQNVNTKKNELYL